VLHPRQDELYELYELQRTHARSDSRSFGTILRYTVYLTLPFRSRLTAQGNALLDSTYEYAKDRGGTVATSVIMTSHKSTLTRTPTVTSQVNLRLCLFFNLSLSSPLKFELCQKILRCLQQLKSSLPRSG